MEKLLLGILLSAHPPALKKALAVKVIESYKAPDDVQICFSILEIGVRYLQQNMNALEITIGELMLQRVALIQPSIFALFFSPERLIDYLDNIVRICFPTILQYGTVRLIFINQSFSLENILRCIRIVLPLKGCIFDKWTLSYSLTEASLARKDCSLMASRIAAQIKHTAPASIQVRTSFCCQHFMGALTCFKD